MGSSERPSRLTLLQRDLLDAFFAREQRMFLTGGGALAGFYFAHRDTEDLDLFAAPGLDLADAARTLDDAAKACGAQATAMQTHADFRRAKVVRGDEECIVDLVIDRAPMIDAEKSSFGSIRVDTLREIAAKKVCTLLSRNEVKDLVDLRALLDAGADLKAALRDAEKKEAGADPATLAWLLSELRIGSEAILPGEVDPNDLIAFRDVLVPRLRAIAYERARRM
jgi:predicted nucleotidyltransferase component of viral defense system